MVGPNLSPVGTAKQLICFDPKTRVRVPLRCDTMSVDCMQVWSTLPSMSRSRQGAGVASMGSRIFVVGGTSSKGKPLKSAASFNVTTNRWTPLPSMARGRHLSKLVAVGSKLVVLGGCDDTYLQP